MSGDRTGSAEALASAETPAAMRAVAIELSKPGLTARAAKHPSFELALGKLLTWVKQGMPEERIEALAVLARLRRQNRSFSSSFESLLAEPMEPLTASPWSIEDPKERDYLAQGLGLVRFEGQVPFSAHFVAGEGQTQTDARGTAMNVLLRLAPSLSEAFVELERALAMQVHETQDPATSRARRLLRVLEALQSGLRIVDPPLGAEPGEAYARMLRNNLSPRAEREVSIEATNVALSALQAWVRPNFATALSPKTFESIADLRRLFLPARWPDETRDSRTSLGRLLLEAISLLAQAGVTDQKLREALVLLVDEAVAMGMLRRLAKEGTGIPNDVRHWLETGHAIRLAEGSAAVSESVLETVDRDLAEAFRESRATLALLESVGGELREAVDLANPVLADAAQDLFARTARLVRRLEAVAAKRGFELAGTAGETIPYSLADHVSDHPIAGSRNVRLVSPMVVRRSAGGVPQVIL